MYCTGQNITEVYLWFIFVLAVSTMFNVSWVHDKTSWNRKEIDEQSDCFTKNTWNVQMKVTMNNDRHAQTLSRRTLPTMAKKQFKPNICQGKTDL